MKRHALGGSAPPNSVGRVGGSKGPIAIGVERLALVSEPDVAYGLLVPAFVMAGAGMALVFAPAANAVLGAVRPSEAGQASGATNTIRKIGGVLGVAVLATVFSDVGGMASPTDYVDGLVPAVWVGAAVLAAGALVALLVPGKGRSGGRRRRRLLGQRRAGKGAGGRVAAPRSPPRRRGVGHETGHMGLVPSVTHLSLERAGGRLFLSSASASLTSSVRAAVLRGAPPAPPAPPSCRTRAGPASASAQQRFHARVL